MLPGSIGWMLLCQFVTRIVRFGTAQRSKLATRSTNTSRDRWSVLAGATTLLPSTINSQMSITVQFSSYLGKPEFTCYKRVSHYIKHYSTILTIIAFVMAGLMLGGFLSALLYLCTMGNRDGVCAKEEDQRRQLMQGPEPSAKVLAPEAYRRWD